MKLAQFSILVIAILCSTPSFSQCVNGSAGGNPDLVDNGNGTYQIACDGGNVNISSATFDSAALPPSAVQWTTGQTGNFTFTPDCNNLGCFDFTPCIPAGTTIPQQCVAFNTLGVPLSGNVPAGGSQNITFNISGICYVPGATYSGDLGINLSGSGDVSLSVVQPDGVVQGPLTFGIDLINSLSPLPLSLLGLSVDPNGTWSITLEDAGAGSFGYVIDPNSEICIDAVTTQGVQCDEPIEICVVEGCPTFVSAQASETQICSGGSFDLSATLNPDGAPNATYLWSGNGITAATQSSPKPAVNVTNTTCSAVTETYTLTLTCTNDGSTIVSNQQVSVVVYPAINASQVVIDNTSNTADPNCSIAISYPPCPGFTISGNTTFSAGDNGTSADYIISNGNTGCDITVSSTVNCIGNCAPANATVTVSNCDANGNFSITVVLNNLGNSASVDILASDGSSQTNVTSTGSYTFGSYSSGTFLNIKIIDPNDPNCSVNLGEYGQNCFDCPNLLSVTPITTDVCSGDMIVLNANVDQGADGVDYSIQWFENGNAITGGNVVTYLHTVAAGDRCNASANTYTAILTCLNNGTVSTTTVQSAGPVNVYPVPEEGIDFVFENCAATPIDNCGNLSINTGGATDAAPGSFTIVNYTIGVAGAPAACQATSTVTVYCPDCGDRPGNGTSTETVVCWGESFSISNNNALVSSLGYEVGYVITTSPPSSYPNSTALLNASLNGVNGAFAAPGNISPENYTNNGSLITPTTACGDIIYVTPFLSFACQSFTATTESGTVETPPGTDFIAGIYQTPGLSGVTLSVPQVPYCTGLVNYNIELCVNDETNDGAGAFGLCFAGEDPLQMSSLFGIIGGLPGGGFSNFPNINNIHDSQSNVCYNQNGWTANPSGEQINMVTVNLQDFCAGGNDSDFMSYDFEVNVNCNSSFPTVCADCDVLGAAVAIRLLPNVTLPAIANPAPLCEGDAIDLTALNPAPSINANGTFTWYEGLSAGGVAVANSTAVVPAIGTTQYCVNYSYCATGDCEVQTCVTVTVDPLPALSAPTLGPVCPGDAFDLSSVENSIASGGNFVWSVGGIANTGGATLSNATNVIPIGSEPYCANFTDANGCTNSVCASFTYHPLPVLFTVNPTVCEGDVLSLTGLESMITTASGNFTWYNDDPAAGGTVIPNPAAVSPVAGDVYCPIFTDGVNGCTAGVCVTPTVNPAPIANNYTPPAVCDSDAPYNLTQYESSLGSGNFAWYNGNPASGGTTINATAVNQPIGTTTYWFELTNATTGCATVSTIDLEVEQCCATVDLRIFFDGFPAQTSWDITDGNGNVVASSGGTYSGQQGNTTLNINPAVCLPDGCYDLNFYDLLNNGMCPFQSSAVGVSTFVTPGTLISPGSIVGTLSLVATPGLCGNYTLYDAAGTTLANGGGAFGASETNSFCLNGGLAPRLAKPQKEVQKAFAPLGEIKVSPSIAADFVIVKFNNTTKVELMNVIGLEGKVFKRINGADFTFNFTKIEIEDLPNGVYFIQAKTNEGYITEKFIKQ